jgi:hypothetical protein
VLVNATSALVDPAVSAAIGLKDRHGNVTSSRNDGSTNAQVTPIYLLLQALSSMDTALAGDSTRQTQWKQARSQLVDQFLDVDGKNTPTQTFHNQAVIQIAPVLVDLVRSQALAQCPDTYTSTNARCDWARDTLTQKLTNSVRGPEMAAALDLMDAIRKDAAARTELEKLLIYLLDSASSNDARAAMLTAGADMVQVLSDDSNVVPFLHSAASAMLPTLINDQGAVAQRGFVDAQLSMLTRLTARAKDSSGVEDCSRELDPNQAMTFALQKLVTPLPTGGPAGGQTPLETIVDVIADVNRSNPAVNNKLAPKDYTSISNELTDFLTSKERGLEQFYEIVREGTK